MQAALRRLALLAPALVLGCGAETGSQDSARPADAGGGTSFASTASRPQPRVVVLDAGAGPKRLLRLGPASGDRQTLTLASSASFASSVAGQPGPSVQMPVTRQRVQLVVEEVSDAGRIRCRMQQFGLELGAGTDSVEIDEVKLQQANRATAKVLQLARGEVVLHPRGFVERLFLELPVGAEDAERIPEQQGEVFVQQLQESFLGALVGALAALPEEPVGSGARWLVKREGRKEGKVTQEEVEYEITRLGESQLDLSYRFAAKASAQPMTLPGGGRGELVALDGEGSGTLHFDLARTLPTTGEMQSSSTWTVESRSGEDVTRMTASEQLDVEFAAN